MGTNLRPIANHGVNFASREIREVAQEIEQTLNQIKQPNSAFLLAYTNAFSGNKASVRATINNPQWKWVENSVFDYANARILEFEGLRALTLIIDEHYVEFLSPVIRYHDWFCMQLSDGPNSTIYRDKWRAYYRSITTGLGGNRLLYAAVNAHQVQEYSSFRGSFAAMERALHNNMGPPAKSFAEVCKDDTDRYFGNTCFIDFFEDLN